MNFAKRVAASWLAVALAGLCLAEDGVLIGQGKAGDWQSDAPGVEHKITIEDLPPDYATPSVYNGPKVVAPPKGAKLNVPTGFKVTLFASELETPRYLLTAPNGDIFVAESYAGRIRVLRDADGDGRPEIKQTFATGLRQPFGTCLLSARTFTGISLCGQYERNRAFSIPRRRSQGA